MAVFSFILVTGIAAVAADINSNDKSTSTEPFAKESKATWTSKDGTELVYQLQGNTVTTQYPTPNHEDIKEEELKIEQKSEGPKTQNVGPINYGTQNFIGLRRSKNKIFVDKSMFIIDIVDKYPEDLLLTYPRRWGKSVNLHMLKVFLEIDIDQEGKQVIKKTKHKNYKYFFGDKKVGTTSLKIVKETKFVKNNFGKWPVVYLDLRLNVESWNKEDILNSLKSQIAAAFEEHCYIFYYLVLDLVKANKIDLSFLEQDELYVERSLRNKALSLFSLLEKNKVKLNLEITFFHDCMYASVKDNDIYKCIPFLVKQLKMYFNKRVFLLIDEYDNAINTAAYENKPAVLDYIIDVMKMFFRHLLKGERPAFQKTIITGVLRISKSAIFSDANNLAEYGITAGRYDFSKYYGATENEVTDMINELKTGADKGKMIQHVKHWYNGYTHGENIMYHLYSIILYLKENCNPEAYLQSSKVDLILYGFLRQTCFQDIILTLLQNPIKYKQKCSDFTKSDYKKLMEYAYNENSRMEDASDTFPILLSTGFLTYDSKEETITIPNLEIRSYFVEQLANIFLPKNRNNPTLKICNQLLSHMMFKIQAGDEKESLKAVMQLLPHIADSPNLQNYLLLSERYLHSTFEVILNRVTEDGFQFITSDKGKAVPSKGSDKKQIKRPDLAGIINNLGVIIEFKNNEAIPEVPKESSSPSSIDEAFFQALEYINVYGKLLESANHVQNMRDVTGFVVVAMESRFIKSKKTLHIATKFGFYKKV